jgi:hypothetical protein
MPTPFPTPRDGATPDGAVRAGPLDARGALKRRFLAAEEQATCWCSTNFAVAHGRMPYRGPRTVAVAWA